jgi:hypothetical protein
LGNSLIILFSQKKKNRKNLKNPYEISAQKRNTARSSPRRKSKNTVKAWAVKLIARMGHIPPKDPKHGPLQPAQKLITQ